MVSFFCKIFQKIFGTCSNKIYLGHQETHISRPLYQTPRQNLQPAVSQHQQGQIQQVRVVQTSQGQEVNQQQIRQVFSTSNGTFQLDGQTYQMISTPNKILQGANGAQLMGSNLITLQVNISHASCDSYDMSHIPWNIYDYILGSAERWQTAWTDLKYSYKVYETTIIDRGGLVANMMSHINESQMVKHRECGTARVLSFFFIFAQKRRCQKSIFWNVLQT